MAGTARLSIDGAIAEIAYSNPPLGLMDETMEAALVDAVSAVDADPAIRVCLHRGGDPGVFIRHYDVAILHQRGAAMAAKGYRFDDGRSVPPGPLHKAMALMEDGAAIHIAALTGTAMGGGFELALACDMRVVEQGPHEFGLPEVNLGILPGAGGVGRLSRIIGSARATEMALLGEVMDGEALAAAGIARACVDDAAEAARALARRLAAKPARALGHIKRLGREGPEGLDRTLFCDLMVGEEALRLMEEWADGARVITDEP